MQNGFDVLEYCRFLSYNYLSLKGLIMPDERRMHKRRKFGYYMKVVDNSTSELIGYVTDISPRGYKMDCPKPMTINKEYTARLDLAPDVSDRSFILFVARVRWCLQDPFDPLTHIIGSQIINISPHDEEIFNRMVEKYGAPERKW